MFEILLLLFDVPPLLVDDAPYMSLVSNGDEFYNKVFWSLLIFFWSLLKSFVELFHNKFTLLEVSDSLSIYLLLVFTFRLEDSLLLEELLLEGGAFCVKFAFGLLCKPAVYLMFWFKFALGLVCT